MEKCKRRHGVCRDWGSGEPPWAGGFHACSGRAGRRRRDGGASARAGSRRPARGNARSRQRGQGVRGPRPRSPEQSRRARGLATHNKKLMSAAAWAVGSVVARPRGGDGGGQGRRGKARKTRSGAGGQRLLFRGRNSLGFASSNGRQRGRKWEALGLNLSMGGEGKGGGERASRGPWRTATAAGAVLPLASSSSAPAAPTPRILARGRAPTLAHELRLWVLQFSTPLQLLSAPREYTKGAGWIEACPPAVGCGRALLNASVRFTRQKVGFNSGMSGSCCEGWNCHQNFAHCECPANDDERLWSLSAITQKQEKISSGWIGLGVVLPEGRKGSVVLWVCFKTLN